MSELLSHIPPEASVAVRNQLDLANEHRDYSIYARLMDAGLEAKARSIFPHFGPLYEGAIIVDAGSGTAKLSELAAQVFDRAHVVALDKSHELLEMSRDNQSLVRLKYGDIAEQNFPDNSVAVKYFSTSLHEVGSFLGLEAIHAAIRASYRENEPGGRNIIRDFVKPTTTEPIYMHIESKAGFDDVACASRGGIIDYNLLSPRALFERFHTEFRGGNAFEYEIVSIEGQEYIKIAPEWAYEYYMRKDYTANWRQEINEKYSFWTPEEAVTTLSAAGYENVRVIPDPNDFILTNRLIDKIGLFEMDQEGNLTPIPFPMTHLVVVGEKPKGKEDKVSQSPDQAPIETVDYEKLKQTISREGEVVKVGDQTFEVDLTKGIHTGSKKNVYWLKGEPKQVLKVVRTDGYNDHTYFKSMYQSIEHEYVLDQYKVPHAHISGVDPHGPPFRYFIQEAAPEGAISVSDLIRNGELTERDIEQMATLVNMFELQKKWQLDTNPFNWHRITQEDGTTQMYYVDGKVYRYDEAWEFRRIGLLQWINASYVTGTDVRTAFIPKTKEYEELVKEWESQTDQVAVWWKKYLHPFIQPQ
ncbi:MAG: methyltransferase domain-containing protein [Candidatus Levybacteria bacterium]|nr:methyltransferase domain-containing protein [Candidatus Levybacteria bacterium]